MEYDPGRRWLDAARLYPTGDGEAVGGSSGHRASAGVEFAEARPFPTRIPFWTNVTLVTECWLARCHLTVMRGQLRF